MPKSPKTVSPHNGTLTNRYNGVRIAPSLNLPKKRMPSLTVNG